MGSCRGRTARGCLLELVDLVEDHDVRVVEVAQAFEGDVLWRGPTVDVVGARDAVEDAVECAVAVVVLPAVHVAGLEVGYLLAEPFGDELRETGLADAARPEQKRRLAGLAVGDGREGVADAVDLWIAVSPPWG